MTDHQYGPWHPGIISQVPLELRHLCTIFQPQNGLTSVAAATELQLLTGFPLSELAAFRPQRLLLHEVLIRVMADFSVPDGSRIGDLGINFREMSNRLLDRYIEPVLPSIIAEYDEVRRRLADEIGSALSMLTAGSTAQVVAKVANARQSPLSRFFSRASHRPSPSREHAPGASGWGPGEISDCERMAINTDDPLLRAGYRALARVMSALFTTHGRAWGTPDLIRSIATDLACNTHGSDVIGRMIEPILRQAAAVEGYWLLPRQERPVIINTKGPSASGKSTLRPLQKKLAGDIGVRWRDFALISPDIWRKQLLDYSSLGAAFKYAGAFTSEELQIVDQKLDRYMSLKQERGEMAHLLIDRFRFDSFAPDSDEAGSNLLTRFGDSVYLFFVITPPEQLVERAWMRGLEFGRYKAVDDTLAHSVEAYTGMPNVFFTWVRRTDKRIHIELLDNSVPLGKLPRTAAFGDNYTLNVLDINRLLDIERFGRVDVNASDPDSLYPDRTLLAPEHNVGFLKRSIQAFREVNFASQATGRIYARIRSGAPVFIDREALQEASMDPGTYAALRVIAPRVFEGEGPSVGRPQYLQGLDSSVTRPTLGEWGKQPGS
ncbi:MAG TPA: hypothetical protein VGO18_06735 [Steroidobacteraceae bacterium]|jgi:hypothetical protein|nr:hypothetical protein [Steroidobacteraceae bacterium]